MALKVYVDFQKWMGRMLHDGSIGMIEQSAAPGTPPTNELTVYPLDKSAVTELYYKNSAGIARDLSLVAALTFGGTPSTTEVGDTAAEGVSTQSARADHEHAVTAPAAPADVTKATAATGTAITVARSDHKHDISAAIAGASAVADTAIEGTATSLARSDHRHSREAFGAAGYPVDIGLTEADGVATALPRSDHQHAHGALLGPASAHRHSDLASIGVNDHHAQIHEAVHISGGGDPFLSTDLLEAIIKRIQTSTGPTTLLVGAIADGEVLTRSGTSIIGGTTSGLSHQQVMARGLLRV